MFYSLLILVSTAFAFGPSLWVRYVLWRHSNDLTSIKGTGGELAQHLVDQLALEGVRVIRGQPGEDYYSPQEKIVSLSPVHFDKRSLAAIAVAAHEVGHAIQFVREEPVSRLRQRYMPYAFFIRRMGGYVLAATPLVTVIVRTPAALMVMVGLGVVTMLVSVLMYVAILPEEYDASFNKALPILERGYIESEQLPTARNILCACAMTYVAGALAEVLSLWRWLRYLR